MKIIVNNKTKEVKEFIDCNYLKIEQDRILLISDRTISISTKDKNKDKNYQEMLQDAFINNKLINIEIDYENVKINNWV